MAMGINTYQISVAILCFTTVMSIMNSMGILTTATSAYVDQYQASDSTITGYSDTASIQGNDQSLGDWMSFGWLLSIIGGIIMFIFNTILFAPMFINVLHVPWQMAIPFQAIALILWRTEIYPLIAKLNPL